MAQTLSLWPSGVPATWNRALGSFMNPNDGKALNFPRTPSGDALPVEWSSGVGGWRLPDGSILGQPRVSGSPPNGYGQIGNAAGYTAVTGAPTGSYGLVPGGKLGTTGLASTAGTASGGGVNPIQVNTNIKNPALAGALDTLTGDYTKMRSGGAVQSFLDRLKESEGTQESNFNRDLGVINERQSGQALATDRAGLANRMAKLKEFSDLQFARSQGASNASQLLRGGGMGSTLRAEKATRDYEMQVPMMLDQVDRENALVQQDRALRRADVGAATNLQDTFDRRLLLPLETERAQYGLDTALLGQLAAIDPAVRQYSYQVPQPFASSVVGLPNGSGYGGGPLPMPPTSYSYSGGGARPNTYDSSYRGANGWAGVPRNIGGYAGYDAAGYPVTNRYPPQTPYVDYGTTDYGYGNVGANGYDTQGYPVTNQYPSYYNDPNIYQ